MESESLRLLRKFIQETPKEELDMLINKYRGAGIGGVDPEKLANIVVKTVDWATLEAAFDAGREQIHHPDWDYVYETFEDWKKKWLEIT